MKGYLDEAKNILYVFPQTPDVIPNDMGADNIAVQEEDIAAWKEANSELADIIIAYNYNTITAQPKVWANHTNDDIPNKHIKTSPGLMWTYDGTTEATEATVTMDADDNVYPYLLNPHSVTIDEYISFNGEVANIDSTGDITLLSPGHTEIFARFNGDDNYSAQDVLYNLTVNAAALTVDLSVQHDMLGIGYIEVNNEGQTLDKSQEIHLQVHPNDSIAFTLESGYILNDVSNDDGAVQTTEDSGVYSFIMPSIDTWISISVIPVPPHDYSNDYLTFEAIEDTTFTFSENDLQYSTDNGSNWTTLTAGTASPTVTAGNKIMWKQTGLTPSSSDPKGIGTFSATGNFNAYGNVMSLYYGDNFVGETDLTGKNYAFYRLFYQNIKLIDTSNLILPATTLAQNCYSNMFAGCTSLTTAPELPATTLADNCYSGMFKNCTSLTTASELSATTLAQSCYGFMFQDCTSLTTAPELPATTLATSCYYGMFQGCTSLTTAPELPATTLANQNYNSMFQGCTSLNYIKCLATNISASLLSTTNWVNGVAATGTFVKDATMSSWTTGNDGIPSGWTVEDYTPVL